MKLITTFFLAIVSVCSYSQVRDYYLAQDFPKSQVTFPTNTDLIEITGVSYSFVKTKLNNYVKSHLKYDRIGNLVTKTSDSTVFIVQRFKFENDPEINPKVDFVEFKYTGHLIEKDTVVERIDMVGSEAMIGEFYRKYWNQELNVIVVRDLSVVSENINKNDRIQLLHQVAETPNSVYSAYSISVTPIDDFNAVLSGTKAFVAKRNAAKKKFDDFRASTVYHMKDIDSSYYKIVSKTISDELQEILLSEENITGTAEVYIKADTAGRTWISVNGKNARINMQLRDELSSIVYINKQFQGFKMTTEDTYVFDYSFIRQDVRLLKKPSSVIVHSDNYPELENIARRDARTFWMDKAEMTYNTSLCIINNEKSTTADIRKVEQKTTAGGVIATILGGILAVIAILSSDET